MFTLTLKRCISLTIFAIALLNSGKGYSMNGYPFPKTLSNIFTVNLKTTTEAFDRADTFHQNDVYPSKVSPSIMLKLYKNPEHINKDNKTAICIRETLNITDHSKPIDIKNSEYNNILFDQFEEWLKKVISKKTGSCFDTFKQKVINKVQQTLLTNQEQSVIIDEHDYHIMIAQEAYIHLFPEDKEQFSFKDCDDPILELIELYDYEKIGIQNFIEAKRKADLASNPPLVDCNARTYNAAIYSDINEPEFVYSPVDQIIQYDPYTLRKSRWTRSERRYQEPIIPIKQPSQEENNTKFQALDYAVALYHCFIGFTLLNSAKSMFLPRF